MAKGLMDMIIDSIFDDEWVGRHGEKLTERELKLVKLFGRKGRTLRNVYVLKDNGETSEIDVVYITQKGIFVFESKNYSGWIFGDENGQYWTAMLPNRQKNRFYNPIKQNRTHIKWLQKYVGENVPLFSIIVFSERCELKKVEVGSTDIKVIKRDRTYAAVRDIWDRHEDAVDDVDALYAKLKTLTNVDAAVKAAHIADIERKYPKAAQEKKQQDSPDLKVSRKASDESGQNIAAKEDMAKSRITNENGNAGENLICPRCGRQLVLRTAKKGANAGKQFYGCSGFPECRYIKNV